jgi:radical SAM protein with 4Fe4S-binding SPASM domain
MFVYNYTTELLKRILFISSIPVQLELHPGNNCAGYTCFYCYGEGQFLNDGIELEKEEYFKLIDDIKSKIKFITLSGIKSDPLSYKYVYHIIKKLKESNLRVGIHTKGLLLTNKLSKLLNSETEYGDFITLSVNASNSSIYNKIHGLNKKSKAFNTVYSNLDTLYNYKSDTNSTLTINVAYLLFKDNSTKEQIEEFIGLFKDKSDRIKFSFPQIPNMGKDLSDVFLQSNKDQIEIIKTLHAKNPKLNIQFPIFENSKHETDFKYCYAQNFQSVIDYCGNIFPCPQIASDDHFKLSYGNIKNSNFWSVWNLKERVELCESPIKKMNCRICDRKDEEINTKLAKMFNNKTINNYFSIK